MFFDLMWKKFFWSRKWCGGRGGLAAPSLPPFLYGPIYIYVYILYIHIYICIYVYVYVNVKKMYKKVKKLKMKKKKQLYIGYDFIMSCEIENNSLTL